MPTVLFYDTLKCTKIVEETLNKYYILPFKNSLFCYIVSNDDSYMQSRGHTILCCSFIYFPEIFGQPVDVSNLHYELTVLL